MCPLKVDLHSATFDPKTAEIRLLIVTHFCGHYAATIKVARSDSYIAQPHDNRTGALYNLETSEVAADRQELMVLQRSMRPSTAFANGQLDPRCS